MTAAPDGPAPAGPTPPPPPPPPGSGSGSESPPAGRRGRSRWLYSRVILVQAVTLLALWLLQQAFGSA